MTARPCPNCGQPTHSYPTCPGYGGTEDGTGILVCWPPCGNAMYYGCSSCAWWYQDVINPRRRDVAKMGQRPDWPLDEVTA